MKTCCFTTHILRILLRRKLLRPRLEFLCDKDAHDVERYIIAVTQKENPVPGATIRRNLPSLLENGYLSAEEPGPRGRCSLLNTVGVNFELTYECNYACAHCLQQEIRHLPRTPLDTGQAKAAIRQVWLSGLCTTGINFTGGEALGHRDDLFELMSFTNGMGIPFRLNTNSWWAGERNIQAGDRVFSDDEELVRFLKILGLKQFAFSFDDRMADKAKTNRLMRCIALCEKIGVDYQMIFTGFEDTHVGRIVAELKKALRVNWLARLTVVRNELVDTGGAKLDEAGRQRWQTNLADCGGTGYYHPAYLHISPEGRVRTCMYAVGTANVGDLRLIPLPELVNNYPRNETGQVFASRLRQQQLVQNLSERQAREFRLLKHQCAKNAFMAKILEKRQTTSYG